MKIRLLKFKSFILLYLILSMPTHAGYSNIMEAIDHAGQQRMLTQRMLKDYALSGMKVNYASSAKELKDSIAMFDENLENLKSFKSNDAVQKKLDKVASHWVKVKEILTAPPQKAKALALEKDIAKLMQLSNEVVTALAKASGSSAGEIVNLAGRQRMLSQRMAALYALGAWRLDGFEFMPEFKKVVAEFRAAQDKLLKTNLNTDAIRKELGETEKNFKWFEYAARKNSDKFIPSLILRASDNILAHMNNATRMYAAQKAK